MLLNKRKKHSKKSHRQPFQRNSLLHVFDRRRGSSHGKLSTNRKIRLQRFIRRINSTYQTLCVTVSLVVRLFILIDSVIRVLFNFVEMIIRIIEFLIGCIRLIRSILSFINLLMSRLMLFTSKVHQIFQLLAILFQPFVPGGHLEQSLKAFSRFLYDFYSSGGGRYSLQARTRHIVRVARTRWSKKKSVHDQEEDDESIFYDALED